jgi:hypothetical protein
MKFKLTLLTLLAPLVLAGPALAGGDEGHGNPEPDQHHYCWGFQIPRDRCDRDRGDTIAVEAEPAGLNCPAAGIKVTVTHPKVKGEDDTEITPEPDVFYVCNGIPGLPGPQGPPGEQGAPGQDGVPGTSDDVFPGPGDTSIIIDNNITVEAPDDTDTSTGDDDNDNTGTGTGATRPCRSTRIAHMNLPRRLGRFGHIRVRLDGGPGRWTRVRTSPEGIRYVRVNLRGVRCGRHIVIGRRSNPSVRPTVRIWYITSARRITRNMVQF